MSGIIPAGAASGQTLYAQIVDAALGKVANGAGLEVYNLSHWGNYTNTMAEQSGSGRYILTIPGYLPAGHYYAWIYLQIGGSPAAGDTSMDFITFDWDGSNILGVGSGLNVTQINGVAAAAVKLSTSASALVTGAAASGTLTTSQMTTNLVASVANIYAGRVLIFTSGVNVGLAVLITAYAVTGGKLTFIAYGNSPAPSAPSAADTFLIL